MSTPTEEQIAFLTHIFTSGYQRGHEDTVEARFTDVVRSEYGTFFRQDVEELVADLDPALLEAARENLRLREALEKCEQVFDLFRDVRGGDGALKPAVDAVNQALGKETV